MWMGGDPTAPTIPTPGGLLLVGDERVGADLDIVCTTAGALMPWTESEGSLSLNFLVVATNPITITARPRGQVRVPGDAFRPLALATTPVPVITEPVTGKQVAADRLLPALLQHGVFFQSSPPVTGEWVLGACELHQHDDPRSLYHKHVRDGLLAYAGNMGYDRYGRFGLLFCWARSPNYGDPGLLDPSYDMRFVQVGDMFCLAAANYYLATGDRSLLDARRERWVSTDGAEPQPLCGGGAKLTDAVLHKGDFPLRPDGVGTHHSLGQSFTATAPFQSVTLRLANSQPQSATALVSVTRESDGVEVGSAQLNIGAATTAADFTVALPSTMPPGVYRVTIGNAASGQSFNAGEVAWWTDPDGHYAGGQAYNHDFSGTLFDQLYRMWSYTHEALAADRDGICSFPPSYGYLSHKSGRPGSCANSFWEGLGNGTDVYINTWHFAAAERLADAAEKLGRPEVAAPLRTAHDAGLPVFQRTFWHTGVDGEESWDRFVGWIDWDGKAYDYGFTYDNVEVVRRGLATEEQARSVFRWLDFGSVSYDGVAWQPGTLSIWGAAPPFNTRANFDALAVGGTLPYREVLTNGGTRQYIAGVDVFGRIPTLGPDNAWERAEAILARYARPDRLTGGRTYPDPNFRGRWHYGPPLDIDKADMEGFRELFHFEGNIGQSLVLGFLGAVAEVDHLALRPRVPRQLDGLSFEGIGYDGACFSATADATRSPVATRTSGGGSLADGPVDFAVEATAPFSRLRVPVAVADGSTVGVELTLFDADGVPLAESWLSRVSGQVDVPLDVGAVLRPGRYQLRVAARGDGASLAGPPAAELESTAVTVSTAYDARPGPWALDTVSDTGAVVATAALSGSVSTTLAPGQRLALRRA
jgi:hypothetical protein